MDNKFLDLVTRILKSGVSIDGTVHPTTKGVPQGGIVSPLLSNVVLNKLDWFLHSKGAQGREARVKTARRLPNVRFTRYADDWCVFLTRCKRRSAERLKEQIRDFLDRECGLRLSAEKTRITHVRDGYDFLGFHLEVSVGKSGKPVSKIKVSQKAITNIQQRLGEAMRYRPTQESVAARITRGSAIVRGWSNYFKIAHNFPRVANRLDHKAFWIAVKAISKKEDIPASKVLRKYRHGNTLGVHADCTLALFHATEVSFYHSAPEPYEPGFKQFRVAEEELEVDFRLSESTRPGRGDLKWKTLIRDAFACRGCGVAVQADTSHADHIDPVSSFASLTLANRLNNLQTLCHGCHKHKHRSEAGV